MVKRFAVLGIGSFWLLATCGALCQSHNKDGDVAGRASTSRSLQIRSIASPLPDAPTPQGRVSDLPVTGVSSLKRLNNNHFSAFETDPLYSSGRSAWVARETELHPISASQHASFQTLPPEKDCAAFFCKYLYPRAPRQNFKYQASSSSSLVGRATDAASRIVLTRDDSGKVRVNSTYFIRVLTSVAAHAASRPYWERPSAKAPLSDFGSTMGNDAGMNLLHEFGPGLHQMVSGHVPQFVSRIEERVRQQKPRGSAMLATH